MTIDRLYKACCYFQKTATESMPSIWYHGSPFSGINSMAEFRGDIMFLTDSLRVAKEYTKPMIGSASVKLLNPNQINKPTIYILQAKIDSSQIFDTRKPEHLEIFKEVIVASRSDDPDDWINKRDLARTDGVSGSILSGHFPSFGTTRRLLQLLKPHNFLAALVTEGTQGASLAITNPQSNLEIVGVKEI